MNDPQRFFFVHMQKTAGTALFQRMRRQFGDAGVYPDHDDGAVPDRVLLPEHLVARWRIRGNEIRVVTGHFPLCTTTLLGNEFTTLTVLREPVERTLSYLRHHRKLTPADREKPLEEIYEDPLRFHGLVHNHMVKMLGLRAAEMTAGTMTRVDFTQEHLDRAKQSLSDVDVFGLQERFEEFCGELTERFGWDLGEPIRSNQTKPEPVAPSFRDRIAEDNALDVELYRFACGMYAARRSADSS